MRVDLIVAQQLGAENERMRQELERDAVIREQHQEMMTASRDNDSVKRQQQHRETTTVSRHVCQEMTTKVSRDNNRVLLI